MLLTARFLLNYHLDTFERGTVPLRISPFTKKKLAIVRGLMANYYYTYNIYQRKEMNAPV